MSGSDGRYSIFSNFCPEVIYDRFGVFASVLADYADELDRDLAHEELGRSGGPKWRWRWAGLTPLHFTECPLYSPLTIGARTQAEPEGKSVKGQEIVTLKPTFYGMGIDLKELGRRAWTRCRSWLGRRS